MSNYQDLIICTYSYDPNSQSSYRHHLAASTSTKNDIRFVI